MADRPLIKANYLNPIVNAQSTGASFNSTPSIIQNLPGISYDISWTGTTTGAFTVQVSNSYAQNPDGSVANAGNWYTLPSAFFQGTLPAPAGSADSGFIDVVGTEAYAVRLVYTRASGTGACTVVANAKVW